MPGRPRIRLSCQSAGVVNSLRELLQVAVKHQIFRFNLAIIAMVRIQELILIAHHLSLTSPYVLPKKYGYSIEGIHTLHF